MPKHCFRHAALLVAFACIGLATSVSTATAALLNGSFEVATTVDTNWTYYGGAERWRGTSLGTPITAQDGTWVAAVRAIEGSTPRGVAQSVATQPGQFWTFSGYAMHTYNWQLSPGSWGEVSIQFFGDNGLTWAPYTLTKIAQLPTNGWISFSLSTPEPAPAGANRVVFSANLHQGLNPAGAIAYDNLSATPFVVPEPVWTSSAGVAAAVLMLIVHDRGRLAPAVQRLFGKRRKGETAE